MAALGIAPHEREDLRRIDEGTWRSAASGGRYEDMTAVNR